MIFTFGSDIGCGRTNNEDFFYIPKEDSEFQNIIMVADGMGGYNAGEIASSTAVETAINYMSEYGGQLNQNYVRSAIRAANNRLIELSKYDKSLKGMGTTMTVAAFKENSVIIGHVGDSRAYLISQKYHTITQLTKDHSYVQMLLDSGEITLEEAYQHPRKNVITRAVGVDRRVKIDTFEQPLEENDIIFLCSDGLARFVTDGEILENITQDFYEGVEKLVNIVKERGGDDNITVVAACNQQFLFDGRYKVIRQVGSGGMAKVYCAQDTKDENKYVTVKLLKDEFYHNDEIHKMFIQEANTAMKLKHKNIINARRIVDEEDKIYIVLDYIEGENLKEYIEKHGAMDEEKAIEIGLQIARALRYAHNNGYIHKDVKPQNIILDKELNAYLTDFGLATKDYSSAVESEDLVLGSVYYFSPEHAKGEAVNTRSDIYSLGIVLYELLCGKLPFNGESTHEVIMGHLHEEPISPNEVNRNVSIAISQVVLKAINKDCELRYVNFNSFMADMKKALKHPAGGFVQYNHVPVTQETNAVSLNKMIVSVLLIASMFVVLFVVGYTAFSEKENDTSGMPSLVNMTLNDAQSTLDSLKIPYSIEYYDDNSVESGVVINQSVKENTPIQEGVTVVIGVAINGSDMEMSDLIRVKRDDAVSYLNSANITDITFEYVESNLPYNLVVTQEPATGTKLKDIKSAKLYLSSNQNGNMVPNLSGMLLSDVKTAAEQNGFMIGIVYEEANKATVVNSQLPVADKMEYDDLSVDIWVGERPNKTILYEYNLNLIVRDDATKVIVCYEEDDGLLYYINEFTHDKGIYNDEIRFTSPTSTPKKIHIFYNNVRQRVIENVETRDE